MDEEELNTESKDETSPAEGAAPSDPPEDKGPLSDKVIEGDSPKAESKGSLLSEGKEAAGLEFAPDPVPEDKLQELIPEGVEIEDQEALKSYLDLVNGAKSRADIVKGTLELLSEYNAKSTEALVEQWNMTTARWQEEVKADPEIGGENLEKTLAKAYQVIQTYSPDPKGFEEVMTLTGAGNSIHVIRLLAAIADAVPGEAAPVSGQNTKTPASQVERFAAMLKEGN